MPKTKLPWLPLAAALLLPVPGAAEDWPQWRGPDRTGVSTETGLARSWPRQGPPVVWEADGLGEGYGAVAVVDGVVYVQGTRGEESRVFALDAASGRVLWSTFLGPKLHQDKGDGPRSTPTVEGDVLYALNGSGELACLEREDGSRRWQVNILSRFRAPLIRWGISESPLVEGDRVVVMPGGREATLAALDKKTGATLWTASGLEDAASYSSLIAADVGDVRVIAGFTQQAGVGVRAADGTLVWRYERPANGTANIATPVVADGLAFYTSAYGVGGGAVRLVASGSEITAQEAWFEPSLQNHHGGVVLVGGHLYGFFGQALGCADLRTGEVRWRDRSVGKGSLIAADGLLFLLGERHQAGLAAATPEGYRELGRFQIEDHGLPSWAHPVVANGHLYLRNQHTLTVYDVSASGVVAVEKRGGGRE